MGDLEAPSSGVVESSVGYHSLQAICLKLNTESEGISVCLSLSLCTQMHKKSLTLRYKIMKKLILALVALAALIFIIGSACAWSNGDIGFIRLLIQAAIGVGAEWFALKKMEI